MRTGATRSEESVACHRQPRRIVVLSPPVRDDCPQLRPLQSATEWSPLRVFSLDEEVGMEPTLCSIFAETRSRPCLCCAHPDCISLKERRLCGHWYFLRWASTTTATPLDMLQELRRQLGEREFHIQPVVWSNGVGNALLKMGPDGSDPGMPPPPLPFSQSLAFDRAQSRAWQLPCCWDAVKWYVPLWLACFRSREDDGVLGETDLGRLLLREIQVAAQGSDCKGDGNDTCESRQTP